jgi:site-specific recombinase XerD
MKWKLPPNVHGYLNRHGKAVFYYRVPGAKKVRLRGHPGSDEFMRAYDLAKAGERPKVEIGAGRTKPGTVNAALVSYYQSSAFRDGLAESSRKMRRAILEKFRQNHGDKRVALMTQTALQNIVNKKRPAAALNFRKAMRGFLDHCLSLNFMKADPLAGVKLVEVKSTGHHTWTTEECRQFVAHHKVGTRERLAYELLLQAGQARCDVVRMGRQHVRNGMMAMGRQKTGVVFNVQITPSLQQAIDAMPASDHLTYLITSHGKPFTAAGFGNWFRGACDAATMPKRCTSHGLRKAAATYFAEQGATDHQLMAWFGWTSISQAQVYTKAANRKRMAEAAGKLITGTGVGSPSNPVSQNQPQDIENKGGTK